MPGAAPLAVRAWNAAGRALGSLGWSPVRIEPELLLDAARRRTGLVDFGDGRFREPLHRLLESLEEEAHLTLLGRSAVRRDVLRMLENRLRMQETWRRHPEMRRVAVERPVFVLGLPRTGTSILHELLAQDPANRVPWTWEVMHPWPPPESASGSGDPRVARVEKHLAGIDRLLPAFRTMHPMGARLPQECVAITAHDFQSLQFHTTWRVPSYQRWLEGAPFGWVYLSHRRWLQYLGSRASRDRWVLKSPGHLWSLDALLDAYPDARIVQTHRDPLRVLASLASLVTALRSLASDRVDPREIGADWAERLANGLELCLAVRDARRLPPERVMDVHYAELVGNELDTVRRIYDRFGIPLGAEAEARMRRWLAEHPKDRRGAHRYALGPAGLDAAHERRRFAFYAERFGVAEEPVEA